MVAPLRRQAVAHAVVVALQVVLLLSVANALREQTWFTSSLSLTITDGPPEGASLNISASVDAEGAHQEVDLFGVLRLLRWQNERDSTAVVPGTELESSDAFTLDLPGPSNLEEQTERVWTLLWVLLAMTLGRGATVPFERAGRLRAWSHAVTSCLVVVFTAMLIIGTPLAWASSLDVGERIQQPEVSGTWLIHTEAGGSTSATLEGVRYTFHGSGFDLGFIPEDERAAAIESAPLTEDASHLAWSGEARWDLPKWQQDLVVLGGLAWFAIPLLLAALMRASVDAPSPLRSAPPFEDE